MVPAKSFFYAWQITGLFSNKGKKKAGPKPRFCIFASNLRLLFAAVSCQIAEHFFNAQQLVVFANTVGSGKRTGLDLSGVGRDSNVGDGGIFGFA